MECCKRPPWNTGSPCRRVASPDLGRAGSFNAYITKECQIEWTLQWQLMPNQDEESGLRAMRYWEGLVAKSPPVTIVHDYLTQRGGAERVVLSLHRRFPEAVIQTAVYEAAGTFPEFTECDIKTSWLQHLAFIRRHHRFGLPLYPLVFSRLRCSTEITLCSTSGWAHGVRAQGTKILYVYNTARWLYQPDDYFRGLPLFLRIIVSSLLLPLRRWDRRAAQTADVVIAISKGTQQRIAEHWHVSSVVLPPPTTLDPDGAREEVPEIPRPFVLTVSRLLPYKHVDAIIEAIRLLSDLTLVIVGEGPQRAVLQANAPENCIFLPAVSDAQLRWLYESSVGAVAAAHEDYGLVPLEAMSFGRPVAVLRRGGYVETVCEGKTGLFFDEASPEAIAKCLQELRRRRWQKNVIRAHADCFSEASFLAELDRLIREA